MGRTCRWDLDAIGSMWICTGRDLDIQGPLCKMQHWWVASDVLAMKSGEHQREAQTRKCFQLRAVFFKRGLPAS